MAKYSFEFKLKVVQAYLRGEGGYGGLAKRYGLPSPSPLRQWVAGYQAFGEEALLRSRKKKDYPVPFKQNAVELYLKTGKSYREVALELGMTNPALIASWVRIFRDEGLAGLSHPKGRPTDMKKQKTKANQKENRKKAAAPAAGKEAERIRELEDQVLSLQIQNAYLKEWRRLQTRETQRPAKKSPASSSDSAPTTD